MKYKATLEKLYTAVNHLDSPTTLTLLNIDESFLGLPETTLSYIARHDHWKRLLDVVASIPHLIEQGSADYVPLVGFLGHFSSGKSTLINAIMGIEPNDRPPYRRESGRNPTDRDITLTTHFDHYGRTKAAFFSPVDKVKVVQGPQSSVMERMTLVDTPGLGDDPAEMATIVRFLHLVHVLVLTVDGRRPFADTNKDFALLDIAFNQLAGVPKIFVITSAVDFLRDRKADFETDWDETEADAFWQETLTRLVGDTRFGQHRQTLTATPHHFVDSIEGFRISNLLESIVPAVSDEEQRARTDAARVEYVINVAVDSLAYLEAYVTERSRHLGKLRSDAEERSTNTQTAIENLIADLTRRLSGILEVLQGDRGGTAELAVPLEQIVTVEAVTEGIDLSATESTIGVALQDAIGARRSQVTRRAYENYRKGTRGLREAYRSEALTHFDIAEAIAGTELLRQLRRCAQQAYNRAMARHQATRTLGLETLERRSERTRVTSTARDIQLELDRFQQRHDDTVKALIAYITQPSSLELLREHGFVGFDESGQRIVEPDSIDVTGQEDYRRIVDEIEECRASLKTIYDVATEELKPSDVAGGSVALADTEKEWRDASIDRTALKPIIDQIAAKANDGVGELDQAVDSQIADLSEEFIKAKQNTRTQLWDIWRARGRIALRLAAVMLLVGATMWTVGRVVPEVDWGHLWASLPDWMIQGAVSNIVTSLALSALFFVLIGFTDANLRVALGSTMLLRLRLALLRRKHKKRLRRTSEERLEEVKVKAADAVSSTEKALVGAVMRWLQNSSDAYARSARELQEIRQRVNERTQLVNGLVSKISSFQNDLAAELRQRSEEIRSDAVSTHISTIREAAEAVEDLRQMLARIGEEARSAPIS